MSYCVGYIDFNCFNGVILYGVAFYCNTIHCTIAITISISITIDVKFLQFIKLQYSYLTVLTFFGT